MKRVVVIGAGTMGTDIALAVAGGGFDVDLLEVDPGAAERARTRLRKEAERMSVSHALQRIALRGSFGELGEADVAIEAVPEDLERKRAIFAQLERALGPTAILATNTSSLSVRAIAQGLSHPGRVIGLHFFNPATRMPLVEIVTTDGTEEAVVAVAQAFVAAIGKTAVQCSDTPGFIVNRVARPYYVQALHALENEVAAECDLDALARGVGFPMGPFELMDFIGLDVNAATTQSLYDRTGAQRLAPVEIQMRMVAQGLLGRKSGSGFYRYDGDAPAPREEVAAPVRSFNEDEVVAVIGYGDVAEDLVERLTQAYAHVHHVARDDQIDEVPASATIVFDTGDGATDRRSLLAELDGALPAQSMILFDAYATTLRGAKQFVHPERLVGYGVLGLFDSQRIVEIVDRSEMSDEAAGMAQEFFGALGKGVRLVSDAPGLFLGRTVASIINEAIYAVQEGVADADDIDVAMRLGTKYPLGPIAWGREIGGARVARILRDLAEAEGQQYAPSRALWMLDARDEPSGYDEPVLDIGMVQ